MAFRLTSRTIRVGGALLIALGVTVPTVTLVARGQTSGQEQTSSQEPEIGYAPDAAAMAAIGESVDGQTVRVGRTVEAPAGEVRWTFVSYRASDGDCLDIVAEQVDGPDEGRVSGCGDPGPNSDPFRWLSGGVELGGRWYNIAFGAGVGRAAEVRLTLADGSVESPQVAGGQWLAIVPDASPLQFAIERIEQVSRSGSVLAAVVPASPPRLQQEALADPRTPRH